MSTPINKKTPNENKLSKLVKEVEMVSKDKNNKKILETFKEQLLRNKPVTA